MTFGITGSLGFPFSEVLQLLQPLGAHSLTFFPIYLPYLHAFLRWRLASWLWGSLFRRFCSFCSLWGLTVSLSSLYIFPIFMHSLGDVWHPGSGVPCFGGFAAFAAFGGSQSHFLPYRVTFGILALGFPVSEVLQLLQPLGAHSLTFFPISSLSSCIP